MLTVIKFITQNLLQILTKNVNLRIQYFNTEILIIQMEVLNEAKNVILLKFLRKIKNTLWIKCCTAFVDY
jgi:hypothetical protein